MSGAALRRAISYLVLILIGLIGLAPFVYLLILSFKNQLDILSVPPSLHFSWKQITSNYGHVIHEQNGFCAVHLGIRCLAEHLGVRGVHLAIEDAFWIEFLRLMP